MSHLNLWILFIFIAEYTYRANLTITRTSDLLKLSLFIIIYAHIHGRISRYLFLFVVETQIISAAKTFLQKSNIIMSDFCKNVFHGNYSFVNIITLLNNYVIKTHLIQLIEVNQGTSLRLLTLRVVDSSPTRANKIFNIFISFLITR